MEKLLVLDFGGQYAHLIAKRFRKLGYYTEIALPEITTDEINDDVKGIILSGGPASVYEKNVPVFNDKILQLNIPILGLCYGHQLLNILHKGEVKKAAVGEYGFAMLKSNGNQDDSVLLKGIKLPAQVWMSHTDEVTVKPDSFINTAFTDHCRYAVLENKELKRFSVQFHAEVKDTVFGMEMFDNFAKFCRISKNWDSDQVLSIIINDIKKTAGDKNVLLFLSGGVDSSVAFALLNKALGTERVLGLYINNGFMRKNESEEIVSLYRSIGYNNFIGVDKTDTFLKNVGNQTDPQTKRKIIGETFINVRDEVVKSQNLDEDNWLLAQGTLYPDIIESGGTKHSNVIKTHHNRVDGIKDLIERGLVIEPLKDLYKDEVREIGKVLGLPDELVFRHPFPGPGISINLLCSEGKNNDAENFEKTKDALLKLPPYDKANFDYKLYPIEVKSVGVQGDFRTYSFPAVLDVNNFFDKKISWDVLEEFSSYITNNVFGVNRTILKLHETSGSSGKLTKSFCNKERLDMIREVDYIFIKRLRESNWYGKIFQHLTISLPFADDEKKCSIVLRPVVSEDVMTARFAHLDIDILKSICDDIKKLPFIFNIYYDITNKPPATFGWE